MYKYSRTITNLINKMPSRLLEVCEVFHQLPCKQKVLCPDVLLRNQEKKLPVKLRRTSLKSSTEVPSVGTVNTRPNKH